MPLAGLEPFIETLGREALSQIQLRKFQLMLEPILEQNTFYGQKLRDGGITSPSSVDTMEAFGHIPFTTKEELSVDQANTPPYGTNLTFPREQYTRIHQTSGTTGKPLRWLDTEESWEWWARCWGSVYRSAGVNASDRIFFAFSFGPFIGFWSAYQGAQQLGALCVPGGGMSSFQRATAILDHDITVLICTPTYALHLAEVADQEGIDLVNSSVRIAILAGEPGASLPGTKHRIETAWGARCYDHAGATEVGAWGAECQAQDGVHVNEGEFICEVVDPVTGEPATEGELVLTNLGRRCMPIIRYRTGDRARIKDGRCDCGRTFVRLDGGVIGRIDDVLIVRGINVFPSAVENIVRQFADIGEFTADVFRRKELDELELRIEVKDTAPDNLRHTMEREVRNALGLRVLVTPVPFGSLPRFDLKARRFTDHRSR